MRALPTDYNGTRFRSRLEADWALNLDAWRIAWIYEPEGYQLSDKTWYSPDFYLPGPRVWLEVKGAHMQRITKVEQFAADLWTESEAETPYDENAPMVILGREPNGELRSIVGSDRASFHGIRGLGKGYSVGVGRCPGCRQNVFFALWQPQCRQCGFFLDDPLDEWMTTYHQMLSQPFLRVKRPEGTGR